MLMTPVGDHGVQRAATGRSEGGEEPQSLGQHVTDMGKPSGEKQSIAPPLQAPGHPAGGDAAHSIAFHSCLQRQATSLIAGLHLPFTHTFLREISS